MRARVGEEVVDLVGRVGGVASFQPIDGDGGTQTVELGGVEAGEAVATAGMGDERERAAGMRRLYDGAEVGRDELCAQLCARILQRAANTLRVAVGLHEIHEIIELMWLATALCQHLAGARELVACTRERGIHGANVLLLPAVGGVRDGRQVTRPGMYAEA